MIKQILKNLGIVKETVIVKEVPVKTKSKSYPISWRTKGGHSYYGYNKYGMIVEK